MNAGEGWIQAFPDSSRHTGLESPERSMLPSSYKVNRKQEMISSSFIFRMFLREKVVTFVNNFRTLLFSQGTFISSVGPKPTSTTSDRIVWWAWFQQKLGKDVNVVKWIAVGSILRKPLKKWIRMTMMIWGHKSSHCRKMKSLQKNEILKSKYQFNNVHGNMSQ